MSRVRFSDPRINQHFVRRKSSVKIRVEFFGLARTRAGVAQADLEADNLHDVAAQVQSRFPELSKTCFENGRLRTGWVFNINGHSFVRDLDYSLAENDSVLLMSADVGG